MELVDKKDHLEQIVNAIDILDSFLSELLHFSVLLSKHLSLGMVYQFLLLTQVVIKQNEICYGALGGIL